MPVNHESVFGPLVLTVRNLATMLEFYQQSVGMKLLARAANTAMLGVDDRCLLILKDNPQAKHPGRTTGLYHLAILLPSRIALAQQLHHLVETGVHLQGAADHVVSEALYLADPEGNGLEIYRDCPRDQWPRESGQLRLCCNRMFHHRRSRWLFVGDGETPIGFLRLIESGRSYFGGVAYRLTRQ